MFRLELRGEDPFTVTREAPDKPMKEFEANRDVSEVEGNRLRRTLEELQERLPDQIAEEND